ASGNTLTVVCAGLTAAAAALGIYFATQNPWAAANLKFGVVQQTGVLLNQWAPDLGSYKPPPNVVAGMLGVLAPVAALQTLQAARQARRKQNWLSWLGLLASAILLAIVA